MFRVEQSLRKNRSSLCRSAWWLVVVLLLPGAALVKAADEGDQPRRAKAARPQTLRLTRFTFVHPTNERKDGRKKIPLPESEFGEMLLEPKTGRCVYHLWFDGIHERAPLNRGHDKLYHDPDIYRPDQYRTVLKGAAGYDGTEYWAARFPDDTLNNRTRARDLVVYEDRAALQQYDSSRGPVVATPTWFNYAPAHEFADTIRCESFQGAALHTRLAHYRFSRKVAKDIYEVSMGVEDFVGDERDWQRWSYLASIDDESVGISRLDIDRYGSGTGRWQKPVPPTFAISRDSDEVDLDREEFHKLTDWHSYRDDQTEITRHAAK